MITLIDEKCTHGNEEKEMSRVDKIKEYDNPIGASSFQNFNFQFWEQNAHASFSFYRMRCLIMRSGTCS